MEATTEKNLIETKSEEASSSTSQSASDVVENSITEEARVKGVVAISIARLQPPIRILIAQVKIWGYYLLVPLKMAQLTIDVIILSLEITKLFLTAAKDNKDVFVQLFQQLVTISSPNYSQEIVKQFGNTAQTTAETILHTLRDIVKEFIEGLMKMKLFEPFIFENPLKNLSKGFQGEGGIISKLATPSLLPTTSGIDTGTVSEENASAKLKSWLPQI